MCIKALRAFNCMDMRPSQMKYENAETIKLPRRREYRSMEVACIHAA